MNRTNEDNRTTMSESPIQHLTQCNICGDRPNPYRISAAAFEPIPPMGPPGHRAEKFIKKRLLGHLTEESSRESSQITNGVPAGLSNLAEAAAYMTAHAPHVSWMRFVMQTVEWSERFALLAAFKITDPEIIKHLDCVRYGLHAATTDRKTIPDDLEMNRAAVSVLEQLESATNDTDRTMIVAACLKGLRDALVQPEPPDGMPNITALINVVTR